MGSIYKQIYRYSHPRAYRHNENFWPYVKISRTTVGDITALYYKKQPVPLTPLSMLRNSCHGRVLMTATGPSVNELCFEDIPDMPAIGVNGAYFLKQKVDFRFYVIVDMGFFDHRPDIVSGIIQHADLTLFTTMHGIVRILDKFPLNTVRCRLAIVENAACKIYHPRIENGALRQYYRGNNSIIFDNDNPFIAFSQDIRHGIFDAGTVAYWALQILTYLGFSQVFIAGLDMNNFHLPRFYETEKNRLPTFLPDKVSALVLPAFRHASIVMKNKGISVKNLSVNSAIGNDIFEKVSCNECFKAE